MTQMHAAAVRIKPKKMNPATAELIYAAPQIEREIWRIVVQELKIDPASTSVASLRSLLWALYRRGRVDYMRDVMHDDTPAGRGGKRDTHDASRWIYGVSGKESQHEA